MIKNTDTPKMITKKLKLFAIFAGLSALFSLAGAGIYSGILGMMSGVILIYYLHKSGAWDFFKTASEEEIS